MDAPKDTDPSSNPNVAAILDEARLRSAARRRWVRALWLLGGLAIAAVAALWFFGGDGARIVYVTEPAARGSLVVVVTATGSLHPTNEVEVSSELSGTIDQVHVDYNSVVRKGDLLAELDTDTLERTVEGARASHAAANAVVIEAQATITEKKRELERKSSLVKRGVSTDQALEEARAAHDRAVAVLASAQAKVAVARADLLKAETNLSKARIVSPIDGIVLSRTVEPGQTVASSLQAPTLFTLAEDLAHMELRVDVDEADVGRVREGQEASFTVDAYPKRSFPAVIRSVRFAPETVQGVVTYKAVLDVDNSDLALRPGMTATADIVVEHIADGLLVPNEGLRWAPDPVDAASNRSFVSMLVPRPPVAAQKSETQGQGDRVYVLRDGSPVAVEVAALATDGRETAVSGDILAGDPVIIDSALAE